MAKEIHTADTDRKRFTVLKEHTIWSEVRGSSSHKEGLRKLQDRGSQFDEVGKCLSGGQGTRGECRAIIIDRVEEATG